MKAHSLTSIALAGMFLIGTLCVEASAQSRESITFRNESQTNIRNLYVSPVNVNEWGPDILRNQVLASGHDFRYDAMTPGRYDLMLVDEHGATCMLRNVAIFHARVWDIDNLELLSCEARH